MHESIARIPGQIFLHMLLPAVAWTAPLEITSVADPVPANIADCTDASRLTPGTLRWAMMAARSAPPPVVITTRASGMVRLNAFCNGIVLTKALVWEGNLALVVSGDAMGAGTMFTIALPSSQTVRFNRVVISGGAQTRGLRVEKGHAILSEGVLSKNRGPTDFAGDGAGVLVRPVAGGTAHLTVERMQVSYNSAPGSGGGVFFDGPGTLLVRDSLFEYNEAMALGGGILYSADNSRTLRSQITHSTFHSNVASEGGGVGLEANLSLPIQLLNSTLASNRALFDGGGVGLFKGGVEMTRVTVADNSSPRGTQIVVKNEARGVDISSTIIVGGVPICSGVATGLSGSNNVLTDNSCGANVRGTFGDPRLGDLVWNGGTCAAPFFPCLTRRPDPAGIAANATPACGADDQRHVPRGPAPCWIGAYEE